MAFLAGRLAGLLLDIYTIGQFLTNVDAEIDNDMLDATTFGASAKSYVLGEGDGKFGVQGYVDNTAGTGSDAILAAAVSGGASKVLTFCPQGLTTIGNLAKLATVNPGNYKLGTPVGGLVSWSADLPPTGGVFAGVLLEPLTQKTNAGNSASSVDNAASSANGGVGTLHCTSYTSGTGTAKIQHSSDNSTFVDLITFSNITAATAQLSAVAGTVNRYTRGAWTGTFVATFALAFARK
jgi:hypothetical protein